MSSVAVPLTVHRAGRRRRTCRASGDVMWTRGAFGSIAGAFGSYALIGATSEPATSRGDECDAAHAESPVVGPDFSKKEATPANHLPCAGASSRSTRLARRDPARISAWCAGPRGDREVPPPGGSAIRHEQRRPSAARRPGSTPTLARTAVGTQRLAVDGERQRRHRERGQHVAQRLASRVISAALADAREDRLGRLAGARAGSRRAPRPRSARPGRQRAHRAGTCGPRQVASQPDGYVQWPRSASRGCRHGDTPAAPRTARGRRAAAARRRRASRQRRLRRRPAVAVDVDPDRVRDRVRRRRVRCASGLSFARERQARQVEARPTAR